MEKLFVTEDFAATLQANQKEFLKMKFDEYLEAAHRSIAQYRVYNDEIDKLEFVASMRMAKLFKSMCMCESNLLLEDLEETYNTIINTAFAQR